MNAHEVPASTKPPLKQNFQRCPIFSVNYCVTDRYDAVKLVLTELKNLAGQYICFAGINSAVMAKENPEYRNILNEAILIFPDGDVKHYFYGSKEK